MFEFIYIIDFKLNLTFSYASEPCKLIIMLVVNIFASFPSPDSRQTTVVLWRSHF